MRALSSWLNRDTVKIGIIFAGLLFPYHWYLVRWETLSGASIILIYSAVFLICLGATVGTAFCGSLFIRCLYAGLFGGSVLIVDSYQRIMGEPFHYAAFVNMFDTASFAGEAFKQFGGHILLPVVAAGLIATGVVLSPRPRAYRYRTTRIASHAAPFFAIALLASVVISRDGSGATGMPGTIVTGAYGAVMVTEKVMRFGEKREGVTLAHGPLKRPADIVLIIDESVRGDYLDISGGDIPSGLLDANGKPHSGVYNFGRAASAANCSAGTNITLRYGGTRANVQRHIATKPTIWQYAKAAGYHTVYMDAQLTDGRLSNSMTKTDLKSIDEFIQFDHIYVRNRDQEIARLIVQRTHNAQPEFIIANKIGAHFPVNDKYPDDYMVYKPASPRGKFANVATGDSSTGIANWDLYKNAYKNTLLWNVKHFLDTILNGADLDRAVILYTSDHGQNFHEDGSTGFGTHCTHSPPASEGIVATALMTNISEIAANAATWSRLNHDGTSHYDIFPTLLDLMAYEPKAVRSVYGPSLFEPTDDPLTFNARFTELGGTDPLWVPINKPLRNAALR